MIIDKMTKSRIKESRTIKNNTAAELDKILKEAENITLDSLNFNKTFKEQGTILCEIKNMLSKNNRKNDNAPFSCNPIISKKLNDKSFNELYQKMKKQNNLLSTKISTPSRNRIKTKLSKKHKRSKITSKRLHSIDKKKTTKYKLNTTYPIVIIKKRTPRKNVIYLNK
jgi:DNA-binding transcriptional MerR regulator